MKYLKNVYSVKTNHHKEQDMRVSHKTTNYTVINVPASG